MIERGRETLYKIDQAICGDYQVPAREFYPLNELKSKKLARGRRRATAGTAIQTLGKSVTTYGLAAGTSHTVFAAGIVLSVFGGMLSIHTKNVNGKGGQALMVGLLDKITPFQPAVEASLINFGFSNVEVDGIHRLPDDIQNSELTSPRTRNGRTKLLPFSIGAAIAFHGDYLPAAALVGAGLASLPVGEHLYRRFSHRTREIRAGLSAKVGTYIQKKHREIIRVTDQSNMFAFTPELLFAITYLFAKGANFLPDLYGFQQSIQNFSELVNYNSSRESAKTNTRMARKLIDAITNRPYIFTRHRWQEHVAEATNEAAPSEIPFSNGLIIKDFIAYSPLDEETKLEPFSLAISHNSSTVIKAESGAGKSITLMGIMHLLEHTGSIHLIKNGEAINIHSLNGSEEVAKEILFLTEEGIDSNSRVIDLFKEHFLDAHQEVYEKQLERHDMDLVELSWKMADNLLEGEIKDLENGRKSSFPRSMLADIKAIRAARNEWVSSYLTNSGGNIAKVGVHPERVFSTLSSGERKRMLVAVAEAALSTRKRTAVIFDEPLANLDVDTNIDYQLEALKRIQEKTALLIVSQQNIEELIQRLDCKIVNIRFRK